MNTIAEATGRFCRPGWGLILLLVVMAQGRAAAQESPPARLTLAELVSLGLEKQPALAAARASLAAAESGERGITASASPAYSPRTFPFGNSRLAWA